MLYVGITNDLERRVLEHKRKLIYGYTEKYNLNKLVYYEEFSDVNQAIAGEKRIKGWTRFKKDKLINQFNDEWNDLAYTLR